MKIIKHIKTHRTAYGFFFALSHSRSFTHLLETCEFKTPGSGGEGENGLLTCNQYMVIQDNVVVLHGL